jgi:hypothetical protein
VDPQVQQGPREPSPHPADHQRVGRPAACVTPLDEEGELRRLRYTRHAEARQVAKTETAAHPFGEYSPRHRRRNPAHSFRSTGAGADSTSARRRAISPSIDRGAN